MSIDHEFREARISRTEQIELERRSKSASASDSAKELLCETHVKVEQRNVL